MLWALIAHVISRISMKDVDVLKSQRHENIWYSMVSVKFSHQMPLTVVKCREMSWNGMKCLGISWNAAKCRETAWDAAKLNEIPRNAARNAQKYRLMSWKFHDEMECSKMTWNVMKYYEIHKIPCNDLSKLLWFIMKWNAPQ